MDIRISKESEVPLRQQLAEQIVFLIATEKLRAGQTLPSVRELARRLKIHHNTVSHAYADLVRRTWLVRRRGSRVVVRAAERREKSLGAHALDEVINSAIVAARERGYTLQELRKHLMRRLLGEPPDHILAVEQEPGLLRLMQAEIGGTLGRPVEACSRDDLAKNRGLAIGALVVTAQYALADVEPLVPRDRPPVPITFYPADEFVERVRKLKEASVIAVVSVSDSLLSTARSFLAPAIARRHTLCEYSFPLETPRVLLGADLVFCDSVAMGAVKSPKVVHYRLISPESLEYVESAMAAYAQPFAGTAATAHRARSGKIQARLESRPTS